MNSHTSDVIVIGAGIIGGSIAWRLSQQGASVTLLDAGVMGGEASTAGAGMLAPGGEVSQRSAWARCAVESLRLYPAFIGELSGESGIPIDYRACGAVELASGEVEWSKLTARARVQGATGISSRQMDRRELTRLGLEHYRAALFYPDDAIVDPRDIMRALAAVVGPRGIHLREHCAVRTLEPLAGEVVLDAEKLSAGAIVLAAGAWSSGLLEGAVKSFPVKGHLVGYNLPPGSLAPIVRHQHTYLLQRSSGFTVGGSTTEHAGFDRGVDPETVASVHERLQRCLPGLLTSPPDTAWIGFRPGAESNDPQVGRIGETRAWAAYGHYRNGILLAPVTARDVAGEIISSLGKG